MELVKQTINHILSAIQELDLESIKFKLMDKQEGHGWTREQADRHELEYKRFLTLLAKYPDELIAPSTAADKFWHGHILDTRKYAKDCEQVFGYFLHHFPYFGMRSPEDAANLAVAAQNMKRLYELEFNRQDQAEANNGVVMTNAESGFCAVTPPQIEFSTPVTIKHLLNSCTAFPCFTPKLA